MKPLSEIAAIVLALPKIESGYVQQLEELLPNGERTTSFACLLRTADKAEYFTSDSPARAALEVLEEIGALR